MSEIREFEFAKQAIKYNVFAYLEKPVDFDEFDEVFEKIKKDLNKKKYSNHEGLIEEQKLLNMEYLSEDIDEINENCSITIKKSLRWIDKNYDKNITLSDAANHVMLSSVYYGRVFKSNVGISFTSYLLDYRLNKARQLLKETMYNVREISMLVGYKDVNYFIRLFKKKYGVSPNEFKKQKQIE